MTSADAITKDTQGKKLLLTNVRMDKRTVKMGTDGRTNGKLFSKVGCHETCRVKFGILNIW